MKNTFDPVQWTLMSQRQRMSPFPNYMSMESVCKEMEIYLGTKLHDIIIFFQGNVFFIFQHTKAQQESGQAIRDLVHRKPTLFAQLIKKEERGGNVLVNFTKQTKKQLDHATVEELYEFFATYERLYKAIYAIYGSVWVMEEYLMSDLLKIIEQRISDNPTKAMEILNTLTRQPSAMVTTIERKALLALAIKIQKQQSWVTLFQTKNIENIKAEKRLFVLIQKHANAYFWLTRDYEDPILTPDRIIERLIECLSKDPAKEYATLMADAKQHEQKRKQFIKELKLSKKEVVLFEAMRDAAHLKELRKRFVSESLYHFDPVLTEIGKRLYLSIKQVRFMRTEDVKRALVGKEDVTEELNARMKLSVWHTEDGSRTGVTTGMQADELFAKFCGIDRNVTEFTGMPVSPGIVKGPVKIVLHPNECDKVEKGDIIVSIQVVPSFSSAIIKCGGIVCDGGTGITSHPATLAREAGVPGVIKTRFAREVLKDGDIVEVDGYKGIVRKIS